MKRKNITLFLTSLCVVSILGGCASRANDEIAQESSQQQDISTASQTDSAESKLYKDVVNIVLSDDAITVDGEAISTDAASSVYCANDIVFYLEDQDFTYGEGTEEEAHSQEEADAHTVVHISEPGTYRLSGELSAGQVAVDLGEDADEDPDNVVTLILDNVDITCSVAPAVIFYDVYECGSDNEEDASFDVDTTAAGANVIIADGSENNITGSHVARIYKSVELNDEGTEVIDSEKLHKYDAAFYSKRTMNVYGEEEGTGILNITGDNEGLDSELHLTINGGNINIESGNDGINTNEDGISVTTVNGGNLTIHVTGSTGEGDGIDSNGWLVINGGSVTASACGFSGDAGIDSDMGIYLNGGSVAAAGNMLDAIAKTKQNYAVFQFQTSQKGGNTYTLKSKEQVVGEWTPVNDFMYLIVSDPELAEGTYTFWCGEKQISGYAVTNVMNGPEGGMMPDMSEGEVPAMPEGMERPEPSENGRGFGGGRGGMNPQFEGEASTEFTIAAGGNQFICN